MIKDGLRWWQKRGLQRSPLARILPQLTIGSLSLGNVYKRHRSASGLLRRAFSYGGSVNELQRKVLLFLLNELHEQVRDMSCDEAEVPDLTEDDRRILTQMLWSHWDELEE